MSNRPSTSRGRDGARGPANQPPPKDDSYNFDDSAGG